jgi:hypothetical protein
MNVCNLSETRPRRVPHVTDSERAARPRGRRGRRYLKPNRYLDFRLNFPPDKISSEPHQPSTVLRLVTTERSPINPAPSLLPPPLRLILSNPPHRHTVHRPATH